MIKQITHTTLLVHYLDEALDFYTKKLDFEVKSDQVLPDGSRWLTVGPKGQDFEISLVQAGSQAEKERVGSQSGDFPMFVMIAADADQTCKDLKEKGVTVLGEPTNSPRGRTFQILDAYGNKIEILQE